MNRVRSGDLTSIGNGDCDLEFPVIWLGVISWLLGDFEIGVFKGGV